MSSSPAPPPTSLASNKKGRAPRPPRIYINPNPAYSSGGLPSGMSSALPPHYTAGTHYTAGGAASSQPYWPHHANPFSQMYSEGRAGVAFLNKGFEGFVDFTKSGMSFGEKFSYGLYDKISKWSKKWFTHIFLVLVVMLYSVGGAVIFQAIEGRHAKTKFDETQVKQKKFFLEMRTVAADRETLRYYPDEWDGKLVQTMRSHKAALDSLLSSNKTIKELEEFESPWTFWNSMFYCGTIYTTIAKKDKIDEYVPDTIEIENHQDEIKIASKEFIKLMYRDCKREFSQMKLDYPEQVKRIRIDINICISHFIILSLFCGFGGLMFRFIEGGFESAYKCEVRKIKRDFIDTLWLQSHSMREDDWKTEARNKLRKFEEELHVVHELGLRYHVPKNNKWDFINSVIYCITIITSIGYGHIAPQTVLGRSVTIIYAIIGIPIFLILLADFGKLFTRCIKFVWGFLRRLYYTGTCRKVRKNAQMQNMMKSIDMAYDVAIRRPSMFIRDGDIERNKPEDDTPQTNPTETPTSQYPGTIIVDDEFNLPISVASIILIAYILCGAIIYNIWEDWTYFESFYFVFISMSTIGFGDFVPNHPIFMMCSILYLIFGLALTSMFINVVQIKLSDSFKHASAKISATIGLSLAEEESKNSQIAESPELAAVHRNNLENISENPNENISPPPLLPRANKDLSPKR